MTKLKTAFAIIIAAMLMFFISGGAIAASAEEYDAPQEPVGQTEPDADEQPDETPDVTIEPPTDENIEDEEQDDAIEDIAANFVDWLKTTFGADYEYYYNIIIEKWGSVEQYLLQFGTENLPEQYQTGWQNFVSWLGEYAPVWAPILAVAVVIIVYIIGKKRFESIVKKAVDSKISGVGTELNKQSKAQIATNRALKALLGSGEKFAENVKELDESEKELNS